MKKLLLVLLFTVLSCSEFQQIEPEIEIEQNCYSIISVAQNSRTGRAIICEERFIINVVRLEVFQAGQPSIYDKIEICVTNPDIGWNDLKLGQTLCDLSVLN